MNDLRKLPWWVVALISIGALILGFVVVRGLLLSMQFGLWIIADSLAEELAIYIPLNHGFLKSITFIIFVALIPLSTLVISLNRRNRKTGIILGGIGLAGFYAVIGYASSNYVIDPISGDSRKCYTIFNGKLTLHDLVPGRERQFDPETGKECRPVTPVIAARLRQYESAIIPNRIRDDVSPEPDMFDRTLGSPLVWYYRWEDGRLELFDNEGFHPETAIPLQPITPDVVREWRAYRARVLGEQKKAEEENRRQEQERLEQERLALLEQQRDDEQRRQVGDDCDRFAGNVFDRNRNQMFPGVPYQLLAVNAGSAVAACEKSVQQFPTIARFRYQLGRALHATGSMQAKNIMTSLVQENYPAAFDNLGWLLIREGKNSQAVGVFRAGAELGNAEAMVSLAGILMEGKWVEKSYQEAMYWFKMAAEKGHPQAKEIVLKYEEQKRVGNLVLGLFGSVVMDVLKKRQ